jgi:arylsulfatase A-like enzyme
MGLALSSKLGFNLAESLPGHDDKRKLDIAVDVTLKACIPFQLSGDPGPDANATLFLQLYAWLHAVVDPHIEAVLTALEESGQAENTIVIFLADHGEYGAAHGMMIEKWHTAYQEALHVPVVFVNNALNSDAATPIQCDALTSHVDILPTVLGLARVGPSSATGSRRS